MSDQSGESLEDEIRAEIVELEEIVADLPVPAPSQVRPMVEAFANQVQGLLYLIRTESLEVTAEEVSRLEWSQAALRAALSSD